MAGTVANGPAAPPRGLPPRPWGPGRPDPPIGSVGPGHLPGRGGQPWSPGRRASQPPPPSRPGARAQPTARRSSRSNGPDGRPRRTRRHPAVRPRGWPPSCTPWSATRFRSGSNSGTAACSGRRMGSGPCRSGPPTPSAASYGRPASWGWPGRSSRAISPSRETSSLSCGSSTTLRAAISADSAGAPCRPSPPPPVSSGRSVPRSLHRPRSVARPAGCTRRLATPPWSATTTTSATSSTGWSSGRA